TYAGRGERRPVRGREQVVKNLRRGAVAAPRAPRLADGHVRVAAGRTEKSRAVTARDTYAGRSERRPVRGREQVDKNLRRGAVAAPRAAAFTLGDEAQWVLGSRGSGLTGLFPMGPMRRRASTATAPLLRFLTTCVRQAKPGRGGRLELKLLMGARRV